MCTVILTVLIALNDCHLSRLSFYKCGCHSTIFVLVSISQLVISWPDKWLVAEMVMITCCQSLPVSSDRQYLSYDGCLEVRGEIIRTVLCCIVY